MLRAIGLMSGTSMDGIDIALIETDGVDRVRHGACAGLDYDPPFRDRLRQAVADARTLTDRRARPGCLADVEGELTQRHAAAVLRLLGQTGLQPSAIDCIGFHGQTVLHRAAFETVHTTATGIPWAERHGAFTVQLGDGPALAEATGIDVVYDLRADDARAGGQGAPLVPVYHRALMAAVPDRPVAVVNVGGVANVTWIGADDRLLAFDTGPGNALIDDWVAKGSGARFDADGAIAARGRVHRSMLHGLLRHDYFVAPPPKSLDRNAFEPPPEIQQLSLEDGAATLTAFTAGAIARAREHMPDEPQLWVICGGGRRNRTLMAAIAGLVQGAVVPAEAVGLQGDSLEAEAWAYLAVRSLKGLPITFPGTTGVAGPTTGGVVARARTGAGPGGRG